MLRVLRRIPGGLLPAALILWGCSSPSNPQIHLDTTDPKKAVVEVRGLSRRDLARIAGANLTSGRASCGSP
jgi:hypothetical protein